VDVHPLQVPEAQNHVFSKEDLKGVYERGGKKNPRQRRSTSGIHEKNVN